VAIPIDEAPSRHRLAIDSWPRGLTRAHCLIGATALVFVCPALFDVLSDTRRPYGYLAPDAFYYFTIAVNWVDFGMPTFDQVHPTNGFHPLWQWIVTLLYALLSALGFSRLALVPVAVVVGLLMLAAAIIVLGLALMNRGRLSPTFSLLPVGAWALLVSPVWWNAHAEVSGKDLTPLFGTLWNFANGLESAVLLLIFAGVVWIYVKRHPETAGGAVVFGALLAALSLARLDHAVFALAIGGLPFVTNVLRRNWSQTRLDAWTLLTWLALVLLYLAYNRLTVGRFSPVSGAEKSTFPVPSFETIQGLGTIPHLHPRKQMYGIGRIGSVTLPALVALIYLPFALRFRAWYGLPLLRLREGRGRLTRLMVHTALATLVLALYNAFFVVSWHIGEWYAPISIVFVSIAVVQAADALTRRWASHRPSALWVGASAAVALALSGVQLAYFWKLHRLLPWGKAYAAFCLEQAPRVVAHYAGAPPSIISRDDGVVPFATGFPTTSGTRLALDIEAAKAASEGQFEPLLERRGINHLTAFHYNSMTGFRVRERSARVQTFAESVLLAPPQRTYEVEYVHGSFGILRAAK
jgi:hypothetical protein